VIPHKKKNGQNSFLRQSSQRINEEKELTGNEILRNIFVNIHTFNNYPSNTVPDRNCNTKKHGNVSPLGIKLTMIE